MGRRLRYWLIFLFLAAADAVAAQIRLEGVVLDGMTFRPLADVSVYLEEIGTGTTTDGQGRFVLSLRKDGTFSLVIRHVGYRVYRREIRLRSGEVRKLKVLLEPRVLQLEGVVLTASRMAESVFQTQKDVSIASLPQILSRTSPNTADAIREVPGVLVQKTTAGHGSPILRGLIGKHVLLLYNGIRLNKPTFRFGANQYMNTIPVEALQKIEVVKGPGSVMYGSDAMGGIVHMMTGFLQPEPQSPPSLAPALMVRFGSADRSQTVHLGLRKLGERSGLRYGLTLKRFGDLRAGKEVGAQVPTGYREWNSFLRWDVFMRPDLTLSFDALAVQQSGVPRYDKYVTGQYSTYLYDPQNRYLAAVSLEYRPAFRWVDQIRWNLSFQLEEEGRIQQKAGRTALTRVRNTLRTWGSSVQLKSILGNRHILTWGYEAYFDRVRSQKKKREGELVRTVRPDFPDGATYRSVGLFVSDHVLLGHRMDMTFGMRWSSIWLDARLETPWGHFNERYADVTGSFGWSYRVLPWMNLLFTYSSGFRAPNFNDTVVLKVSNAGMDAPSPNLVPEKSHNVELGVRVDREPFSARFFLFFNRLINLIDRYPGSYRGLPFFDENSNGIRDEGEPLIFQKRNVAQAYIWGWEFQFGWRFLPGWQAEGFAFYTFGQNVTYREPMSRIPPLMGRLSVQYRSSSRWMAELFLRGAIRQSRLSTRDKLDSRIPEGGTPGWITINFRLMARIAKETEVRVVLENLLDETYKEHGSGVYSPGRGIVLTFTYGMN
jgi:outer membrane receptor protein involved in Fe transport